MAHAPQVRLTKMKQKVLFIASTYSHIVNFHLPYLRKFREESWTVHVACGGAPMPIPDVDQVIDLPFEKSMWSLKNLRASVFLSGEMRRESYDLIITHTSLAAFFTRLALWGLEERPAVANMVHGYLFDDETPWLKQNLLLGAERWMAADTDLVLTMNRWDYETAKKYQLGHKVVNIPGMGVDFSRFDRVPPDSREKLRKKWGVPESAFVLIYAAEFSERKSQSVVIRTMEHLPEQVWLILAGEGTLREDCRELTQKLGLEDRVLFPGQVRDIPVWYAMADAAVSTSRSEGLPFNIMEAMYAGLPVIASEVKGHTDLIEDGTTGLLYPYGDEKACAEQILRLTASERLRRELARNAKADVKQYGLERVMPIVWEGYCALSSRKMSGSSVKAIKGR